MHENAIREAKTKADIIMREATLKSEKMIEGAQRQIEKEHVALAKIQKEVSGFKNRLLSLYKQHLELISALPSEEEEKEEKAASPAVEEASTPVEPVREAAEESEEVRTVTEEPFPVEDEKLPEEIRETEEFSEEDVLVRRRGVHREEAKEESRFGPLKFGRDYDLNRTDRKR